MRLSWNCLGPKWVKPANASPMHKWDPNVYVNAINMWHNHKTVLDLNELILLMPVPHINPISAITLPVYQYYPDSKVHGANMGPIWGRQDPGGSHVGPMNFAIWVGHQLSAVILKLHWWHKEVVFMQSIRCSTHETIFEMADEITWYVSASSELTFPWPCQCCVQSD